VLLSATPLADHVYEKPRIVLHTELPGCSSNSWTILSLSKRLDLCPYEQLIANDVKKYFAGKNN
jgi:hypothetical protein